jgi:hypothetical protein
MRYCAARQGAVACAAAVKAREPMTAGAQRVASDFVTTGGVARGADLFEQRALGLARA